MTHSSRPSFFVIVAGLALVMLVGVAKADIVGRATVELKTNPTVNGTMITLGDLFENAGIAAEANVIAAPPPGQTITIDAKSLASLAEDHGLDWANLGALGVVQVTRAGREINAQAIGDALAKTLSAQAGGRDLDVRLLQGNLTLEASTDDPSPPRINIITYDEQSGRFDATIDVPGGAHATVSGTADEVMSVPVLSRAFQRGEVISESDLTWARLRVDSIGRQMITEPKQMIGLSTRRPLRSGLPILVSDIEHPAVLIKGAVVTMSYKVPGMTLTNVGRAQENGAIGDTVSVLNEQSHRTVQAIVTSANSVELAPSLPVVVGTQASIAQ